MSDAVSDPPRYLIDTAAIAELEGLNPRSTLKLMASERQRVWGNLDELAKQGRIATVYAAKDEIQRKIPEISPRLEKLPGFFLSDSAALWKEVTRVIGLSTSWKRQLSTAKAGRDLVGPYLVAMAVLRGYVVVTSEQHRKDRPLNFKTDENLPDVCDLAQVSWRYLVQFITDENL